MKKILVPTDFSDHGTYAAKVAAKIARITNARIYFLHVVDIPVYDTNMGIGEHAEIMEGLLIMKQVKQKFQHLFAEKFLEGINAVEVLTFSGVHENIAKQVEKYEIDLIVMGSHGAKGWTEFFVGSNTEKIVRLVNCPVITVKRDHDDFNPKTIVFSSAFDGDDNHVFENLVTLAKLFDSKIHLLKVNTPSTFEPSWQSLLKMKKFAERFHMPELPMHTYNAYNIEEGILAFSKEIQADLISMGTRGRSGLALFFTGSVASDLVNHARRPVFTMRIVD